MQQPRILVLSPVPLVSGTDGTRLRGMSIVSALQEFASVRVMCFDDSSDAKGDCPLPRGPGAWERLLSLQPSLVRCFRSTRFAELVGDQAVDYDLCVCIGLQMFQYARFLPPGMPVVIDNYNVESNILRGLARQRRGIKRLYWHWQAFKLLRFERKALALASCILAISQDDRREFLRLVPQARVELVAPGLDLESCLQVRNQPVRDRLVFVGALGWHVNVESCRWMAQEVFPKVRRERPQAELQLVGRSPTKEVLSLDRHEGVSVHADVPAVEDYLAQAAVVVVPLPYGSGVQTKVIQALAAGKAVVTTPVGFEGLDLTPGVHLMVAQDASEFASQCLTLMSDTKFAEELGQHGRIAAVERYSWSRLVRDVQRVCQGLLN